MHLTFKLDYFRNSKSTLGAQHLRKLSTGVKSVRSSAQVPAGKRNEEISWGDVSLDYVLNAPPPRQVIKRL